jgi:hypothetical protein
MEQSRGIAAEEDILGDHSVEARAEQLVRAFEATELDL